MGYAWNGVCHPTTAAALAAFSTSVPSSNASGINTFTSAPTISGSGLVTWSISNRTFNGTTAITRTGTTQLLTCTESDTLLPTSWTTPEMILLCAMVGMFAIGFRTGLR